jgi:disulfide bond formation protein DsbB
VSRNALILTAAAGSLALLLGALVFQYLGGMAPCKLCLWQRWPHAAAVAIGLPALWLPGRILPLAGALAALATGGIGAFHSGVERGWWDGPASCTSGPVAGLSTDALMAQIMAAPLVRCDAIPWEMFTLSMASWNVLASLVFALIWLMAARAPA